MLEKKQVKKRTTTPLVIEPHPPTYTGYPFITLISYRNQHILTIVDNSNDETIKVYVLDYCGAERVNEEDLITAAIEWYDKSCTLFPFSIELSRRNMTEETSKIYRTLNVEYVSRVIGPMPVFPVSHVKSIKRRRRKPISAGVEIVDTGNVVSIEEFFN